MKTKLLLLIFLGFYQFIFAQNPLQYCAQEDYIQNLMRSHDFNDNTTLYESNIYNFINNQSPQLKSIITIPVVFHIIHNNGVENISDAQVQLAIENLNEAFSNTGFYNSSTGVNTEIQFCLAKQSPSGTFTTGINRVVSPLTEMTLETQDIALKALSYWNSNYYLNIWVVKAINSLSSGVGVAGYATLPGAHGSIVDGIVIEAPAVGANKQIAKALIHEAGHYLGLYHTFQGGCGNTNCLLEGDRVCDTPPDNSVIDNPCSTIINSCTSDADDISTNNPFRPTLSGGIGEQNDLNNNYMDYGNINCLTAFTNGQMTRMRYSLDFTRASLKTSIACNSLCTSATNASFISIDTPLVSGTSINFNNTSTGAISYRWTINNVLFSSISNPTYTFNSSGTYIVCLEAHNNDTACTTYFYDTIQVTCLFDVSIVASNLNAGLNSTINFTATATGASSINWYLDGIPIGTGSTISHFFNTIGGYYIQAIATDGICYDTSSALFINIGMCNFSNNYDKWYFGFRAGVDFSSGTPIAIPNSSSNMFEGNCTYCNNDGRVIMYSGANVVFDSTNIPMPNSAGLLGATNNSSTQGTLFLRKPASDSIYYIFTTDEEGGSRGLRYSEINMNLRGGLGDVTSVKNILLYAPTCEKLFAIRHCNGRKAWLLSHDWNSNRFIVYKIDDTGIDTTKIISAVGSNHGGFTTFSHGQLIASPDGKKVAIACQQGFVEILDFDNNTGLLSNPKYIPVPLVYGLAFSPNSKVLYAVGVSFGTPEILQYDISAGSAAAIIATRTIVGLAPGGTHGCFQLHKNGKIYQVNGYETALCVIDNPNTLGVGCNFIVNAVSFTPGRECRLGLNNIPVTFSSSIKPALIGVDTFCANTIQHYDVVACTDSTRFYIIGNAQIVASTSTGVQVSSAIAGSNQLIVKLMSECGVDFDTFNFYVKAGPLALLPSDTTLCTTTIQLAAGVDANSYLWNTGDTTERITITSSGSYWVRKTSTSGCIIYDTTNVNNYNPIPLNLGNDTLICTNEIIHLNASNLYSSYLWQDGLDLSIYSAYHDGLYYVTVKDICNHIFTDSITIYLSTLPNSILPNDTCITQGNNLCITASNILNYIWNNGDTTKSICISPIDSVSIWVTGNDSIGCIVSDTIQICILDVNAEKPVLPNTFSPNGDGLNDYFTIINLDKFIIDEFTIWNRWGGIVYNAANNLTGWNGKINSIDQPIGSYVYFIKTRNKK